LKADQKQNSIDHRSTDLKMGDTGFEPVTPSV
jgi:hypothetical protein